MKNVYNFEMVRILTTSGCNLNCTHCYQFFEKNKFILPKDKIVDIIDYACKNKVENLVLSGGEFFTHPDAYEILDYCISKNVNTVIVTNATLINLEYFKHCKYKNLISFQVSIDGMKEKHDLRRGKGTFECTIKNMKQLYTMGFSITISMAIDENNYTDIIEVLNIPYANKVNFLPIAYTGAAVINKENNEDDYQKFNDVMIKIYKSETEMKVSKNLFPNELAIKYDGGVYPSAVAQDYDILLMGNVLNKNIEDVINSYVCSDEFNKLKYDINKIDECNKCKAKNICNKGCRERAYKVYSTLSAPDPFCCKIYKNEFPDVSISDIFWGNIKLLGVKNDN